MFDIRPTEILPSDSPGWLLASPLPRKMYVMKGVTVSGVLYMTGEICECGGLCYIVCFRW